MAQGANIVIPLQGLFDPAWMVLGKTARGLDGGLHIPGTIGIQHDIDVIPQRLAQRFDPRHVFVEASCRRL